MGIGTRIKQTRKQRGITARFVASKVGISPSMLSEIEREKCNVTIKQLVALSDFFEVSTDYLIKGSDNTERLSA